MTGRIVFLALAMQGCYGNRPQHQDHLLEDRYASLEEGPQILVNGEDGHEQITFTTFGSGDPNITFPEKWLKPDSSVKFHFDGRSSTPIEKLSYLLFGYALSGLQIPKDKPEYWRNAWKGWQSEGDFRIMRPGTTDVTDTSGLLASLLITPPEKELDEADEKKADGLMDQSCEQGSQAMEFVEGMSGKDYDAVKPLQDLLEKAQQGSGTFSIFVPWYRFCQQERTSKYFCCTDKLEMTKDPEKAVIDDAALIKIGDDAAVIDDAAAAKIDNAAIIDLPVSELYFRFMLSAASNKGSRPVEVEFNDAHEPLPLIKAAREMSAVTGMSMKVKLTSSFKFYLKTLAEQIPSNQKFVVIAPDNGQWTRLTTIMEEFATEMGGTEFNEMKQKITLAHFGALRTPAGKEQTCCYSEHDVATNELTDATAASETMRAWATSVLQDSILKDTSWSSLTNGAAATAEQLTDGSRCPLRFLVVDDFTNSGSTLFNAAVTIRQALGLASPDAAKSACVSAFVSHLLGKYDISTVKGLIGYVNSGTYKGNQALDHLVVTTSIPLTVEMLGDFSDGTKNDGKTAGKGVHFEVVSHRCTEPTGPDRCPRKHDLPSECTAGAKADAGTVMDRKPVLVPESQDVSGDTDE